MNAKMKDFFSFSVTDVNQKTKLQNEVELVACPLHEMICKTHLSSVNKMFFEAKIYRREKNFEKATESLKMAFQKTNELMGHPCNKCTKQFRSTIIATLEDLSEELRKISKGFFGNKHFLPFLIHAENSLKEFKSNEDFNSHSANEHKKRFLGNHLN